MSPMTSVEITCLHQLFKQGPTWDGNIVSKVGRSDLIKRGLADRISGFAFLTKEGVQLAASVYEREKI